jgi:RNase H-fold protein (predicted Holliday junction resolvase)
MSEHAYLNLNPKYSDEEIGTAMRILGQNQGGIHGFEFGTFNVTQELERLRRKKRLAEAGFKEGTVKDLLNLSEEEMHNIDLRVALSQTLRLGKALDESMKEREKLQLALVDENLKLSEAKTKLARHQLEALDPEKDEDCPVCELEDRNKVLEKAMKEMETRIVAFMKKMDL